MSFYRNKSVLVTGGAGFIGSHVVDQLVDGGALVTVPVRSLDRIQNIESQKERIRIVKADLADREECEEAVRDQEIIIHMAVHQGGLGYSIKHQGMMFRENMQSFLNVIEAARRQNIERMLTTSSACVYPRYCTIPTPEREGFLDEPEPTNSGYGWSKRMAEKVSRWYVEEYGMKIGIARPYNAYGPRDNFNLETSHVIPALIKRIIDGENPVMVWGSGKQSRSFLYVADFARGLLDVAEKYAVGDPINIGADEEITIKELVFEICRLAGTAPRIVFDESKPEGQPRRKCDTTKAKEKIGYTAQVSLSEGLKKTIDWYRNNGQGTIIG